MKNHTTAALRVEPFHILKTNEYCTPILEIAPLKTIQPDSVRGNATHPSAPPTPSLPGGVRIFFWTILVVLTLSLSFLCILLDSCRPR